MPSSPNLLASIAVVIYFSGVIGAALYFVRNHGILHDVMLAQIGKHDDKAIVRPLLDWTFLFVSIAAILAWPCVVTGLKVYWFFKEHE